MYNIIIVYIQVQKNPNEKQNLLFTSEATC